MGAQLDRVLAYLDRQGVTELVIAIGRPLTLRRAGQVVPVTNAPVTRGQLATLVHGSPLADLVPDIDGARPPVEVDVGARRVRVRASRRGDEVTLSIEPAPATAPADEPRRGGRARGASIQPTNRARTSTRSSRRSMAPATQPSRTRSKSLGPAARTKSIEIDVDLPSRGRGKSSAPATRAASVDIELALPTQGSPAVSPPPSAPPPPFEPPALDLGLAPPAAARAHPVALDLELPPPSPPPPTARPGLADTTHFPPALVDLVRRAHQRGASDLHVATGRPTSIRVLGELVPIDPSAPPASAPDVEALLGPLIATHRTRFEAVGYIDLALESPVGGRLRTNLSRHQGGLKGTFRIARAEPPSLDALGLPRELAKVTAHHQGLVVIAGPSGHGKTTTLAALVDVINAAKPHHIITVEDPVEIVYPRKAAVMSQREVGAHTKSFAAALKGSLREDPDVIVIGELRDRETVEIALTAAETGHLVLATMSTPSAAKTIDRLVDMFPPDDQSQVRASIAGALRAIVAQRLLPAADGSGMVAAVELLTGCLPLAMMIRDDKLYQLPNLMQRGRAFGMIRLDESLTELVRNHRITAETALAHGDNKRELSAALKPAAQSVGLGGLPPRTEAPRGGLGGLFGRKGRE